MVKECIRCREEKPIEDFHSAGGERRRADCKTCRCKYNSVVNKRVRRYRCPDMAVYGIFDSDGLCYIGSSKTTSRRLYLHFESKASTHHQFMKDIDPFRRQLNYRWEILWSGESDEDRVHQEKMLIQIHQPKFNKIKYKNYNG